MCRLVRTLDEYGIEKCLMVPLRETITAEVAFNNLIKNGIVIIKDAS